MRRSLSSAAISSSNSSLRFLLSSSSPSSVAAAAAAALSVVGFPSSSSTVLKSTLTSPPTPTASAVGQVGQHQRRWSSTASAKKGKSKGVKESQELLRTCVAKHLLVAMSDSSSSSSGSSVEATVSQLFSSSATGLPPSASAELDNLLVASSTAAAANKNSGGSAALKGTVVEQMKQVLLAAMRADEGAVVLPPTDGSATTGGRLEVDMSSIPAAKLKLMPLKALDGAIIRYIPSSSISSDLSSSTAGATAAANGCATDNRISSSAISSDASPDNAGSAKNTAAAGSKTTSAAAGGAVQGGSSAVKTGGGTESSTPVGSAGGAAAASGVGGGGDAGTTEAMLTEEEAWAAVVDLIAVAPKVSLVSFVYGELGVAKKRSMRRSFGSLLQFLRKTENFGCVVSRDGLRVTRGPPPTADEHDQAAAGAGAGDAATTATQQDILKAVERDSNPPKQVQNPADPKKTSSNKKTSSTAAATAAMSDLDLENLNDSPEFGAWATENLDEIYQPEFPNFVPPPPPANLLPTKEQNKENLLLNKAGVFSPAQLVPIIPSFFVPISRVVEIMPTGYDESHLRNVFVQTGVLQIVDLEGEGFVRLHGGKTQVDMAGNEAAREMFKEFAPDPALCDAFIKTFDRPYQWKPLREVVEKADPAAIEKLPFKFYKSLLFFSQMQHRFGFTAENGGELCYSPEVETLDHATTPLPEILNVLTRAMQPQPMAASVVGAEMLNEHQRADLLKYFPSVYGFCRAHGRTFWTSTAEEGEQVMLQTDRAVYERKKLPIEEQLDNALDDNNKQLARKLRRRIAVQRNPDNPLLDKAKLQEEVHKYLPLKRAVNMQKFKKDLPPDLTDLFPSQNIHKWFASAPHLFELFEFPGRRLYVMRKGLPLPDGRLRSDFTEAEIIQLTAAEILERPRRCCDIFSRMPTACKEIIHTRHRGLYTILAQYPQYFTLVVQDALKVDTRLAKVKLIARPPIVSQIDYGPEVTADEIAVVPDDEGDDEVEPPSLPLAPSDREGSMSSTSSSARRRGSRASSTSDWNASAGAEDRPPAPADSGGLFASGHPAASPSSPS